MCWSAGRGGISWSLSFQRLSVSTQVSQFCLLQSHLETLLFETFIQLMDGTLLLSFNGYLLSCVYFCWIRAVGYFFTAHSHNISPSSIYTQPIPVAKPCQFGHHVPCHVFDFGRYIDYNVKKLAKPGSIARHTDNDSMVTMVASWRPWKKSTVMGVRWWYMFF